MIESQRPVLPPVIHREYLHVYPHLSDTDALVREVCNYGLVLPQHKLPNCSWHMPCCALTEDPRDSSPLISDRKAAINDRLGWRKCRYMIVLPAVQPRDLAESTALHPMSNGGAFFRRELQAAGIPLEEVVVTYVGRFSLPRTVKTYSTRHQADCLAYLQRDIIECDPDVIIAVGAASFKALFGESAKLDSYRGNVVPYQIRYMKLEDVPNDEDEDRAPEQQLVEVLGRRIPVIPTTSHLSFMAGYANISVFRSELLRAYEVANGYWSETQIDEAGYEICRTADAVEDLCRRISEASPPYISVDTEFGNDLAREEFSYVLSIQLGWGKGKAAFIQLRDQVQDPDYEEERPYGPKRKDGSRKTKTVVVHPPLRTGVPMHSKDDLHRIWSAVQRIMLDTRWKIVGQHLRVDVRKFGEAGYPIDERIVDGIDTMLIHHLLCGDEDQGLDHLTRKYCSEFGAFWSELEQWLTDNGRPKHLRFGYRDIPLSILIPYALRDADVTWRLVEPLLDELKTRPRLENLYWTHVTRTSWHLLRVERNGILVDEEQRQKLFDVYDPVYRKMLDDMREAINWPGFNPGSKDNVATFLFWGTPYKNAKPPPDGAMTLGLAPLMNTDKYPKPWEAIIEAGDEDVSTPSTKASTIDLLSQKHPELRILRKLKYLSVLGKFRNTYLAPQELNEFGVSEGGAGFHQNIWTDYRVRTNLSQLTETGRYSSSRANLQTKPKKQESAAFEAMVDFYFDMTVKQYEKACKSGEIPPEKQIKLPKFASVFTCPDDSVLIEADFKTAEVFVWAYASGDQALIDLVSSGRDMHSENAAKSFNLPELERLPIVLAALESGDSAPYDAWADEIKSRYGSLRTAAKTVVFG